MGSSNTSMRTASRVYLVEDQCIRKEFRWPFGWPWQLSQYSVPVSGSFQRNIMWPPRGMKAAEKECGSRLLCGSRKNQLAGPGSSTSSELMMAGRGWAFPPDVLFVGNAPGLIETLLLEGDLGLLLEDGEVALANVDFLRVSPGMGMSPDGSMPNAPLRASSSSSALTARYRPLPKWRSNTGVAFQWRVLSRSGERGSITQMSLALLLSTAGSGLLTYGSGFSSEQLAEIRPWVCECNNLSGEGQLSTWASCSTLLL
mmetsp:Transcript_82677/g.252669  ORF Transcript_82677/g.252669 Transcript_82677/m.252669 type:complete len:257 (-) Transcript_82677:787-1557(-)